MCIVFLNCSSNICEYEKDTLLKNASIFCDNFKRIVDKTVLVLDHIIRKFGRRADALCTVYALSGCVVLCCVVLLHTHPCSVFAREERERKKNTFRKIHGDFRSVSLVTDSHGNVPPYAKNHCIFHHMICVDCMNKLSSKL